MPTKPLRTKTFKAGCGRTRQGPRDLKEIAYQKLEFVECPECVHRLMPEGAPDFCRWLDVEQKNPLLTLGALKALIDDD